MAASRALQFLWVVCYTSSEAEVLSLLVEEATSISLSSLLLLASGSQLGSAQASSEVSSLAEVASSLADVVSLAMAALPAGGASPEVSLPDVALLSGLWPLVSWA